MTKNSLKKELLLQKTIPIDLDIDQSRFTVSLRVVTNGRLLSLSFVLTLSRFHKQIIPQPRTSFCLTLKQISHRF